MSQPNSISSWNAGISHRRRINPPAVRQKNRARRRDSVRPGATPSAGSTASPLWTILDCRADCRRLRPDRVNRGSRHALDDRRCRLVLAVRSEIGGGASWRRGLPGSAVALSPRMTWAAVPGHGSAALHRIMPGGAARLYPRARPPPVVVEDVLCALCRTGERPETFAIFFLLAGRRTLTASPGRDGLAPGGARLWQPGFAVHLRCYADGGSRDADPVALDSSTT